MKQGDVFDRAAVEAGIKRIFSTGWYFNVNYAWVTENQQNGLVLTIRRRKWFDNYLRFGLSLTDNFEGDATYRMGLNWRTTSLNDYGAYLDVEGEIGQSPRIAGEFYQPLGKGSPYFIAPAGQMGLSNVGVTKDGNLIASYDRTLGAGAFKIGRELGSSGEIATTYLRGEGRLERDIGDPTLPNLEYSLGEINSYVVLDSLDEVDFPTSGYFVRAGYRSSNEDFGDSDNFEDYSLAASLPLTFGTTTIFFAGEFSFTAQDRPGERSFSLGGFGDISGYQPGSMLASDYWLTRIGIYNRFAELKVPLFGFGFFYGGSVEFASLRSDIEVLDDTPSIFGGSLFVGANTPIVPAYLSFGMNDEGSQSITLNLGRIMRGRR